MRRILWLVPLVALLALIGWRVVQKQDTGSGGGQGGGRGGPGGAGGATSVEVATAGPRTMTFQVEAVGTAASPQTVRLSPPVAGRITFLQAREGDRVTAGETLARIDPAQIEGTVLQAESAVAEAQSRLAQAQATIGAQDVTLQSAIGQGRAGLSSARAALDQAQRTQAAQVNAAKELVKQQAAAVKAAQASVVSAQAQEEAARGTLKANQARLVRTQELYKGGYIAAQDVDDAQAQVATAIGNVRVAQQAEASAKAQVAQARAQQAAAAAQVIVAQRETQGAILTAQAQLRTAQATLASANANTAQREANRANVTALQASVRSAQGQLDAAQAQRANTELKSPIDGTITLRAADPGTLAQPGTPVLTIQVVKRIFVESSFPVEYAGQIRSGETATVLFDNLPDRKFTGRITDVNQAADPQSRQFTVRVLIENTDETIRPGMFGRIQIVTRTVPAAVVVPLLAVTETDGKATVAVPTQGGTVEVREVTLGERDEQGVQILKGLKAGEKVVTERARALKDGAKIRVSDPNMKPPSGQGQGGQGQGGGRRP